nr:MAG TPA: hypothetical protein [Caudoviricetes sp.]
MNRKLSLTWINFHSDQTYSEESLPRYCFFFVIQHG